MASAEGAAGTYAYMKQRNSREKGEKTDKANVRKWECVHLATTTMLGEESKNGRAMVGCYTLTQLLHFKAL